MSILWRSWIALTVILATVLCSFAVLSVLQHNAVLSQLIRQRLAVVVEATAAPFRSVIELGLPISMVRNAGEVLDRARSTDPKIVAIHAFNPTGIVVHSTDPGQNEPLGKEILLAESLSSSGKWSLETEAELLSGVTLANERGAEVGGIVAIYPKDDLELRAAEITRRIAFATVALLLLFSAMALVVLRLRLHGSIMGLKRLTGVLEAMERHHPRIRPDDTPERQGVSKDSVLGQEIDALERELEQASVHYRDAMLELEMLRGHEEQWLRSPDDLAGPPPILVSVPETPLARRVARQLVPWAAAVVLAAAILLGYVTYQSVNRSIQPELLKRTELIGTVANNVVQRAVSAGIPLDNLVGADEYFTELLRSFPEVSYIGIATSRIILEVGAPRGNVISELPIEFDGKPIGQTIIEANPDYLAAQFRNVLLDFGVILMVVILLAFELMVVLLSFSLAAPFERLQHLVSDQAAGDFSKRTGLAGRNVIDRLAAVLSERSERLHRSFAGAWFGLPTGTAGGRQRHALEAIEARLQLCRWRPRPLRFCHISDVRLPLFLFAAADEFPLAFFPLYVRAADNSLGWLDQGLVISLPLVGYLLAVLLVSPFARTLSERLGHRNLFLLAAAPTLASNLGLFFASDVLEIIFFRTLSGAGYALAMLACQDYVIDVLPREARAKSLGLFSAAMFGGIFAGSALGGIIADRLGQSPTFLVSAALVAVSAILIYRLMPPWERTAAPPPETDAPRPALAAFRTLSNFRFSSLVFGIVIPQQVLDQVFVSYLLALQLDALGASVSDIARMLMVYFLMIIVSGSLYGRLSSWNLGPSVIALGGTVLSGLALLAAAVWPTWPMMLLAIIGTGVGHGLVRGPQVALVMDIAETSLRHLGSSTVLGTLRGLERGGSIVGLIIVASLTTKIGYDGAMGIIALWVLAGAMAFVAVNLLNGSPAVMRGKDAR